MPHPVFADLPHPRVLAHRGFVAVDQAARGIVENSVAAVGAAVDLGADIIETDCRVTRDGVVVLAHDADLARSLGDPRPIATVDSRELAELMAPRGGLLTLAEAFERFPRARFNIDVKVSGAAEEAGRIAAAHAERALLNSFSDARRLRALRAAAASLRPGALQPATSPGRATIAQLLGALRIGLGVGRALRGVDALQIPERQGSLRVLSPRLLRAARRAGVEVHVWTINDPAHMLDLAEHGVDGIVTDRADLGLAALAPLRR